MQIAFDPDATKVVVTESPCYFHQKNPGASHPGCNCVVSYSNVRTTPEEYAERRKERLEQELKDHEARAGAIRRELGHQSGGQDLI